jgi:hypothetical protein
MFYGIIVNTHILHDYAIWRGLKSDRTLRIVCKKAPSILEGASPVQDDVIALPAGIYTRTSDSVCAAVEIIL